MACMHISGISAVCNHSVKVQTRDVKLMKIIGSSNFRWCGRMYDFSGYGSRG